MNKVKMIAVAVVCVADIACASILNGGAGRNDVLHSYARLHGGTRYTIDNFCILVGLVLIETFVYKLEHFRRAVLISPCHIQKKFGFFVGEVLTQIGDEIIEIRKVLTVIARIVMVGLNNDYVPRFRCNNIFVEAAAGSTCRACLTVFYSIIVVDFLIFGDILPVQAECGSPFVWEADQNIVASRTHHREQLLKDCVV